ncbi:hypothetical protein, partial [Pseudomonas aeruginosa]|uniref:hypothetical protein n=1 Tax=Pseudomonas aeruginosa TaxID=287 RepID=UPI001ED9925D
HRPPHISKRQALCLAFSFALHDLFSACLSGTQPALMGRRQVELVPAPALLSEPVVPGGSVYAVWVKRHVDEMDRAALAQGSQADGEQS